MYRVICDQTIGSKRERERKREKEEKEEKEEKRCCH